MLKFASIREHCDWTLQSHISSEKLVHDETVNADIVQIAGKDCDLRLVRET